MLRPSHGLRDCDWTMEPCMPPKGGNRRSHCAICWGASGILLPLVQHLHKDGSVEPTVAWQHITTRWVALQHSAIGIYELHLQYITTYYNILQHITTYYNITTYIYIYISTYHDLLQGYSVHIPVSCSNRSHRLFRWISGPAVLSVINFVLRRSPWVDKHQAGPWLKRKGRRMKKEYWYCFNMFQSDSIHRCWRYVSRCFNPIQSTSFNNFQSVCQMQMLDSAYGAMLCIWTTVFLVPWTYRPDVSTCRSDKAPVPPWNSIETTGTVNHGMANHVLMHCLYIYIYIYIHVCTYKNIDGLFSTVILNSRRMYSSFELWVVCVYLLAWFCQGVGCKVLQMSR